jgi:hypothetical protein
MLRDDKIDDLKRMYSLFGRVSGGLAIMRDLMSNDVREIGKAIVNDEEKVCIIGLVFVGILNLVYRRRKAVPTCRAC